MSNKHETKGDSGEARGLANIAKAIREHAATNRAEPPDELKKRNRQHHWIQIAGTVVAAIYAGITLGLWLSTRRAVQVTEEQVHIRQRAYVIVDTVTINKPLTVGQPVTASLTLKNTGRPPPRNPALKVL